ncbi:MAG: hypothetical protein GC190_20445 [Alphaproteobacteria bacterium]|nr:hypothetical protein [Alphaproteobacteria bacterium]
MRAFVWKHRDYIGRTIVCLGIGAGGFGVACYALHWYVTTQSATAMLLTFITGALVGAVRNG